MKSRFFSFVFTLFVFVPVVKAQVFPVDLHYTITKNFSGWKKGEKVHIVGIKHDVDYAFVAPSGTSSGGTGSGVTERYLLLTDKSNSDSEPVHEITSKVEKCMECDYKTPQDLWDSEVIANVLYMLKKKGTQIDMRNEMESDAIEFIVRLQAKNLLFNDPYLESYIYGLVSKIAPKTLADGRPGNVNVVIMIDPNPNAMTFSNGTIVITTGLLSVLHTEDELVAILAHEIAHFVLDHTVINVNKEISRQKRAAFWAAVATGVTAVAEGAIAVNSDGYYKPGVATRTAAIVAAEIASKVVEHLGMKFNHEQEDEADALAQEMIKILGYDKNAFATALSRLQKLQIDERSNDIYFSSYTHPALVSRIEKAGVPQELENADFERIISFAITQTAISKFNNRRFRQVLPLVTQNIENKVATADDYILRANCILYLYNDPKSNKSVLEDINMAKSLDSSNLNIYKAEIIALLRNKEKQAALDNLTQYISDLELSKEKLERFNSDELWESAYFYYNKEIEWAREMQIKLRGM